MSINTKILNKLEIIKPKLGTILMVCAGISLIGLIGNFLPLFALGIYIAGLIISGYYALRFTCIFCEKYLT